jgi:glycerol uptake facilitator-like aquaporin
MRTSYRYLQRPVPDQACGSRSTKARAGSGLWFAEALATFGLILTIFGTQRWKADMVPVTAGLYIASAYWFTASTSFANPAVTIARCITNTFAGIQPLHAPAFIVAQLLGALAATLFCWFMFAQVSEHANRRSRYKPVATPFSLGRGS